MSSKYSFQSARKGVFEKISCSNCFQSGHWAKNAKKTVQVLSLVAHNQSKENFLFFEMQQTDVATATRLPICKVAILGNDKRYKIKYNACTLLIQGKLPNRFLDMDSNVCLGI